MARSTQADRTTTTRMRTLALSTALALAPLPALALEADGFAEAFKALIAAQDGDLNYASASLDGDAVTLTGATLAPVLPEGVETEAPTIELGDLTFQGVTETEIGYEAASLMREGVSGSADDINEEGDDLSWAIGRLGMEGITVPNAEADSEKAVMARTGAFYDRGFIEDASISLNGEEYVTLASAETGADIDASPVTFAGSITDLVTDLTVAADKAPDLQAWIEGTGYDVITIDYESDGTWDLEDGTLDAATNRLTLEGMGEFDMTLNLAGMTPAFLEAVQEASEQLQSGEQAAQQAGQMQVLGLLSQLSFGELTLAYRDGGMADKLLDYYATVEGTTREQLVTDTLAVLPLALGQLGAPELQAQITEAATAFLNDPQSMVVSLKPDAPVPAPVLMGAAASSPAQLFEALNATVTSNEMGAME